MYGWTRITGWIDPNLDGYDSFSVPSEAYNPLDGAEPCDHCKGQHDEAEPHLIVKEGLYTPPSNNELYKLVRGKRIEIRTGPKRPKEQE
jgi:hypothetical protein